MIKYNLKQQKTNGQNKKSVGLKNKININIILYYNLPTYIRQFSGRSKIILKYIPLIIISNGIRETNWMHLHRRNYGRASEGLPLLVDVFILPIGIYSLALTGDQTTVILTKRLILGILTPVVTESQLPPISIGHYRGRFCKNKI